MASLMITGAKIGAIIGLKRAFAIGAVIYGCGSFTTSIAPNLPVLLFGWSFLEGVGAALILPAIVALVAGNFPVERRPAGYGLVAAAGAIAVATGPLIGGIFTTYFSWRWVFAGEVLIVFAILILSRGSRTRRRRRGRRCAFDVVPDGHREQRRHPLAREVRGAGEARRRRAVHLGLRPGEGARRGQRPLAREG